MWTATMRIRIQEHCSSDLYMYEALDQQVEDRRHWTRWRNEFSSREESSLGYLTEEEEAANAGYCTTS